MEITARVTGDAIVKPVKNLDKEVVSFGVAINHSYRSKGAAEATRKVVFVECDFWRSTAIAPFLTKGMVVQLFGYPEIGAYINKKGYPIGVFRLHVQHIELLGGGNKNATGETGATEETGEPDTAGEPVSADGQAGKDPDDLPF